MVYVSVKNGTRAGWKTQREQPEAWTCICGEFNPRYLVRCRECKAQRET